ncbi:hypothetical protein CRYUN_Cryun05aG0080700 [Craigia yunnanensis]
MPTGKLLEKMGLEIVEPNTCVRGCCSSNSIPLHLPPPSFTLLSPIARGAESVVYEAILDGKKVAAKKPILSTSEELDKFHKELQLLCKIHHPGIATLLAAHAKPPNYMFFFEFYEQGNLAHKLHVQEWIPDLDQALLIMLQLAKALQYLHNQGIIHRDVKPANVLLDRNFSAHLADFGLAEYKKDLRGVSTENWRSSGKPTGGFHKKNMVGTLIYMAPEILTKEIHTEKSDVYSFGVSINELLTGVIPYTDIHAEAQAHTVLEMNYTEQQLTAAVVSGGLRPVLAGIESGVPASILSLIQKCWDANPQNRPSFNNIVLELDGILQQRKKMEKKDLSLQHSSISHGHQDMDSINILHTYRENINWSTQGEYLSKRASVGVHSGFKIWLDSFDDSLTYHPVLSWGSFSTCGRREIMEDTHFLMPYICNEKDVHVFGIFDGHRGAAAAEFSVQALPEFMKILGSTCSPADALLEAFVRTDVAFRDELDSHRKCKRVIKKDWHPGCTAAAALIVRNKLFVANAGDCRTILCRSGCPLALSRDHVASCPEERKRVVSAGGQVKWQVDTWRVGPAALQVMASDGLWDVVSNTEVITIIRDTVKEPAMCSKRLATEAAERGSKDNITVIVVFLRPVSTAERVY